MADAPKMPELPEPVDFSDVPEHAHVWGYTADQMRAMYLQGWRDRGAADVRAASSCGQPVGAGDGCTYVPGTSSDAVCAIRAVPDPQEKT